MIINNRTNFLYYGLSNTHNLAILSKLRLGVINITDKFKPARDIYSETYILLFVKFRYYQSCKGKEGAACEAEVTELKQQHIRSL